MARRSSYFACPKKQFSILTMSKERIAVLNRQLDKAFAQHDNDEIVRIDRELRKLEVVRCPKHPGVNIVRSPCPFCEVGLTR